MNHRTGRRQTVFVCTAISEASELLTRVIAAASPKEAADLFEQELSLSPQEVLGPFFKKKVQVIESTRVLKFAGKTARAIYNDWVVDAFFLAEPENQAYLVFIKRNDGKSLPFPKGTIVVPISDLRIIQ